MAKHSPFIASVNKNNVVQQVNFILYRNKELNLEFITLEKKPVNFDGTFPYVILMCERMRYY